MSQIAKWIHSSGGKIGLMAAVIGVDQVTKIWAVTTLKHAPPQSFWGDLFRLEYAENSGAFLSLGAQLSGEVRFWIFVVAVSLFVLYVLNMIFFDKRLSTFDVLSWCMIASGGVGNLIDRSTRENHGVVDFLNVGVGSLRTGIFNVADMAIMAGVFLLFYQFCAAFFRKEEQTQP